jgi:hypothetical protein
MHNTLLDKITAEITEANFQAFSLLNRLDIVWIEEQRNAFSAEEEKEGEQRIY